MIVSFERSGGFAGIALRSVVNSELLSQPDRAELQQLLEAADFFALPEKVEPRPGTADVFHFKISVEDGGRAHTTEFDQADMPERLKPLVHWLRTRAKPN